MHITRVAIGSHGDAQPFIALGLGLKRAGYQVRIAVFGVFDDFVKRYDLEFAAIAGNPRELIEQQKGQASIKSGKNPVALIPGLQRLTTQYRFSQLGVGRQVQLVDPLDQRATDLAIGSCLIQSLAARNTKTQAPPFQRSFRLALPKARAVHLWF